MPQRKYLVYKIINKQNGKIYIGVHTTEDENDNYMGSGVKLKQAIQEYGLENFEKTIIHQFNTEQEMLDKERELVNEEFIARNDTYNVILGGNNYLTTDTISVRDEDGNCFRVHKDDPRYLSGELVNIVYGRVPVKDKQGNTMMVDKDDPRYLSGELVHNWKNKVTVKDENGNTFHIDKNDPRYLNGGLIHIAKNTITVKDENGNTFSVHENDPRYLSGELIHHWKGRKHSTKTKQKLSGRVPVRDENGNCFRVHKDDPRYLSGELVHVSKNRKHSSKAKDKIKASNGLSNDTINKRINDYYNEPKTNGYKYRLAEKWNVSFGRVRKFLKQNNLK